MESNRKLKRKENIITADMKGSAVTMDVTSGKYYNLGETGGLIWNHMEEEITFDDLVDSIAKEYGIDPAECEADIEVFLQKLIADGLVICR